MRLIVGCVVAVLVALSTACGGGGGGGGGGSQGVSTGGGGGVVVGGNGPAITSVSPGSGDPGATITIAGSGFATASSGEVVRFGGVAAGVASTSATQITALVPSLPAGSAPITVEKGGVVSSAFAFTVTAPPPNAPSLTALGPASGPAGTSVLLGGTNLGGVTSVTIGGTSVATTTGPRFAVPSLAPGLYQVVAVDGTTSLTSAPLAFVVTPVLTGVNPSSQTPGGSITISGTNLGSSAVDVRFGASAVVVGTPTGGGTSLTVAVPSPFAGALPASLSLSVVANPGKSGQAASNGLAFTVLAPAGGQPAAVTQLSPTSGPVGTSVVASGSGFGASPSVTVGGVAASVSASTGTTVTFTIPSVATGARSVVVTGPGGASSGATFTVTAPASTTSLVSIEPPGGVAGQLVTLRGAGFGASGAAPAVSFGGVAASVVTFTDASVAVRVPPGASNGTVQVVAVPSGGSASNGLAFVKSAPAGGAANTFAATGAMTGARVGHTATLLASGKVLIAGGDPTAGNAGLASAEVYDPATGAFAATSGPMSTPRQGHTATRLPDGRVLIVGGYGDPGTGLQINYSTDIYDPATGAFSRGPDLGSPALYDPKDGHVAVPCANGDVLLCGGETVRSGNVLPSTTCWRYSFQAGGAGSLSQVASLNLARLQSAAIPTFGGAAVVGGQDAQSELASLEIHDQVLNTWTKGAQPYYIMNIPRVLPTAVRLASGDIAALGGFSPNDIAYIVSGGLYDPMTSVEVMPTNPASPTAGQFAILTFATPRVGHSMTVLADDRILVAGSAASNAAAQSADVLDATISSFSAQGVALTAKRFDHTATLLFDGRVLLTGGGGSTSQAPGVFGINLAVTASAELYRP